MQSRVNVQLHDGSVCQMSKKAFNIFLSLDKVTKFERADGWAVVGKDLLRDLEKKNDYPEFADRRISS